MKNLAIVPKSICNILSVHIYIDDKAKDSNMSNAISDE